MERRRVPWTGVFSFAIAFSSAAAETPMSTHDLISIQPIPKVRTSSSVNVVRPGSGPSRILPRARREAAFRSAEISGFVARWDELDRDLLALRAKEWPLARLAARYPEIPAGALPKLKAALE